MTGAGWLHGLELAAAAVVAAAVLAMARTLERGPARLAAASLGLFGGLLVGLPLLRTATGSHGVDLFATFYRSGALVFGGGHVVLPLLDQATVTPDWVGQQEFLAGYGAAQAVPGPLFTFSAYLGAVAEPSPNGVAGAGIALGAIFLPSFLLLGGCCPRGRRGGCAGRALPLTSRRCRVGVAVRGSSSRAGMPILSQCGGRHMPSRRRAGSRMSSCARPAPPRPTQR